MLSWSSIADSSFVVSVAIYLHSFTDDILLIFCPTKAFICRKSKKRRFESSVL